VPAGALQPPEYPWMKEKKAAKKTALPPAAASTGPACLGHKGQSGDLAPGLGDPCPPPGFPRSGCGGGDHELRGKGERERCLVAGLMPLWSQEWVWWRGK
jgi:hypothetical protein